MHFSSRLCYNNMQVCECIYFAGSSLNSEESGETTTVGMLEPDIGNSGSLNLTTVSPLYDETGQGWASEQVNTSTPKGLEYITRPALTPITRESPHLPHVESKV